MPDDAAMALHLADAARSAAAGPIGPMADAAVFGEPLRQAFSVVMMLGDHHRTVAGRCLRRCLCRCGARIVHRVRIARACHAVLLRD